MALNAEPADPIERYGLHLPFKSYADAVEEGLKHNGSDEDAESTIDESIIKESPPRLPHLRNGSVNEPRALGEVIDEAEANRRPTSPTLRHPKGRLEQRESRESYADMVKETPSRVNGHANGGDITPETFDGMGEDEEPRSPTRKTHLRTPSKQMNGVAFNSDSLQISPKGPVLEPVHTEGDMDGKPFYENIYNKSGDNLASLKPDDGYYLSLAQRENKPPGIGPPVQIDGRDPSQDNKLVSGRQAGAGWSRSAIRWAPWNVPLQRRLQTLIVLLHTLSIAGGLAIFFLLCTIPLLWPILLPYLLYVLLSRAAIDGKLSHRSEWARRSKVWSLFASYFPVRLHRSQPLEPTRKYIFGYHPHGIISHGAFAAFATEALGFSQLFPGITNTLLTLDTNFRTPLYRDYALRMGLASVSRESCENLLTKGGPNGEGMGRAITIVVGGARESLEATPFNLRLVLKKRKGFVKLAIRTGADLVPVLAFGENDIYEQLDTNEHPHVHKVQLLIKKFMGFTIPLFHARGMPRPYIPYANKC